MAQYPVTGMSKVTGDIGLGTASFAPVEYSPETQAYLKAIADAAAGRNPGIGNYYSGLQSSGEMVNSDVTLPVYNTEDAFKPYLGLPVDDNLGYQFALDGKWGSTGQVSVGNKTPIYLVDDKTGKVVNSGIGFASAEQIAQQAKDLGAGHAWSIYTGGPPGVGNRAAQNEPQMGALEGIGKIVSTVGPGVGAALGGPFGAALVAAVGGGLQGKSVGDILLAAAKAGFSVYAMGQLQNELTGATTGATTSGGSGPLGTPTFAETAGALSNYTTSIPGFATVPGIGGGIGGGFDDGSITISGRAPPTGGGFGPAGGTVASASFGGSNAGEAPPPDEGNIVVTARPAIPPTPTIDPLLLLGGGALTAGALTAATGGTAGGAATSSVPPGTPTAPPTVQPAQVGPLGTPTGAETAANLATTTGTATLPVAPATGILGSTLGLTAAQEAAITTALKAAGLGLTAAGLLGGGGGGSGGTGTIPGGLGTGGFSPLFSAAGPRFKPADTGAARTASDLAARGLSTPEDYYRYASGPAQSFHTGVQPGAMNSNRPFTGYAGSSDLRVATGRPMIPNTTGLSDLRVAATDRPETVDFAVGGRAQRKLRYEDLTPQEKNAVDYHRRNLEAGIVQRNPDGTGTSFKGGVNELNGRETYFPTFWSGRELPLDDTEVDGRKVLGARSRAIRSGIDFPSYPTFEVGLARERRMHDDIMEPDMEAYMAAHPAPMTVDRPMIPNTTGSSDLRVAAPTSVPEPLDYAEGGPIKAPSVDAKEYRLGPLPGYRVSEERGPRGRIDADEKHARYSADVPIGRGSLSMVAEGRGLAPEDFFLGAEYPVGDAMLYAEDMLGAPSFGVRLPIGDATLDAATGGHRRQGFADKARLRMRVPFEGGGYAVGGSGDGRDDKIPAMLSDGEYVVDAETVALLGNGSSKAGADALDRFRVSVRKHKGRELAKGSFSVKAKKPEQYLKRGRK